MQLTISEYKDEFFSEIAPLVQEFQAYLTKIDNTGMIREFTSLEESSTYLRQLIKDVKEMNGAFFIAFDGIKPIGFIEGVVADHTKDTLYILTHKPTVDGWIGVFYIQEEYRGKGISKLLYKKITQAFIDKKCTTIKLFVSGENAIAQAVYKKYGFITSDLEMARKLS